MALKSNMSVYTAKTNLSSILKTYSPSEREKSKTALLNKVRFEMPREKGILEVVKAVEQHADYLPLDEFVCFLNENTLNDTEFSRILNDARKVINQLGPKFSSLVEALLALQWSKRSSDAIEAYTEFCIGILVAHNKYLQFGISKLIALWIPNENDAALWLSGTPSDERLVHEMHSIHKLLERILNAIPMAFDAVLDAIESMFPYYKKPSYIVVGYVHNVLLLLTYKPIFTDYAVQLFMQKLVILDVNAPRSEIENAESDEETEAEDEEPYIFEMDDCRNQIPSDDVTMNHPIAQTLDMCMSKLFDYLDSKNPNYSGDSDRQLKNAEALKFLKVLLNAFDNVILPSHNTHHVQFLLFYYCNLKITFAETFLSFLWDKIKNLNCSVVIRQASVGYMASFLARSRCITITVLKEYLKELCTWAHRYIQDCDQYRSNGSLKANLVFFSACQAIFYVIAFRSRDLTRDKKSLLFLQSLHLSAIVTCNFNPLRVCLPAVATAFAGVTRAYQLAYCHAILERNARRKLATVYANETATPEETLDTFFPFDPYLLKSSGKRIRPQYLQYQASEAEEQSPVPVAINRSSSSRKRGDSEMMEDYDVDDFLISDKRQRLAAAPRTQERETQFTYGLSPGFHI